MSRYHHILGIPHTASKEEVKKAYRKLALKYHPDITSNDPIKNLEFLTIKEAYENIINSNVDPTVETYTGSAMVFDDIYYPNGDVRLYIRCQNIVYAETLGILFKDYNWTLLGYTECSICIKKEDLKRVNYSFDIRFHTLSGNNIVGRVHLQKPLTKWEKFVKSFKLFIGWKKS